WFTINELMSLAAGQYIGGQFPPNHHFQLSEAIQANHNMLLAHALAVLEFHQLGIEGEIGCIHALKPGYPIDGQKE
ncbi:family 1 glycosylhydrolase, partial [Streptococcus pneumoniae]